MQRRTRCDDSPAFFFSHRCHFALMSAHTKLKYLPEHLSYRRGAAGRTNKTRRDGRGDIEREAERKEGIADALRYSRVYSRSNKADFVAANVITRADEIALRRRSSRRGWPTSWSRSHEHAPAVHRVRNTREERINRASVASSPTRETDSPSRRRKRAALRPT